MTFPPPLHKFFALTAFAVAATWAAAPPAAAAMLTRVEADALGGTHVVLPADAAGKPFVLLLAYTPEAKGDLTSWSRGLVGNPLTHDAVVYVAVVAVKTAFVSRSHIRRLVEGAAVGTREQIDSNVLVTFNGTGWLTLVPPGDKTAAGVVVCDANGNVLYAQRMPFTPARLAEVQRAIKS